MQTETENKNYLLVYFALIFMITGCISVYDTRLIPIEILEPAKVYFPQNIKKVALRYNNTNIANKNSLLQISNNSKKKKTFVINDSILSELYFDIFSGILHENKFFDSVYVLNPEKYSNTQFIYSLPKEFKNPGDSLPEINNNHIYIYDLVELLKANDIHIEKIIDKKFIDKDLGLYNSKNLHDIRDTTSADLLFSFDYFETLTLNAPNENPFNLKFLYFISIWNIYDLNEMQLKYCYFRKDSVFIPDELLNKLRNMDELNIEEAVIESTVQQVFDIIPHWVTADRTIYTIMKKNFRDANEYIDEGRWLEAAELWKTGLSNRNNTIVAQCMFNLAVACELAGDFNAALDWISKSFKALKHKDVVHEFNCREYLRILGRRKFEKKLIDFQLNPELKGIN